MKGKIFLFFALVGLTSVLAAPVSRELDGFVPTPTTTPTATPTEATFAPTVTPAPTPSASPFCIGRRTDICIAADASTSLGNQGWNMQRRFIRRTISGVENTYVEQGQLRFSGIVFGTGIYGQINFRRFGRAVIEFFNNFEYQRGWTRIDRALKKCANRFERSGDAEADYVVVLISDGNGRYPGNEPIPLEVLEAEADALKAGGVRIFTVGVGDDGYESVLRALSGEQGSTNEYYANIEDITNFNAYARQLVIADECREGLNGFEFETVIA